MTATNTVISVVTSDAGLASYTDCMVKATSQATDTLTYTAQKKPDVAIPVAVQIIET